MRLRRGFDLPLGSAATGPVVPGPRVSEIALLAADLPGMRAESRVEEGARVDAGAALLGDDRDGRIVGVAPGSGTVSEVRRGGHGALHSVVLTLDDEQTPEGTLCEPGRPPESYTPDEIRDLLLRSGLWTGLRKRPLGHVARPDEPPAALFVTAIDTEPLAPSIGAIVGDRQPWLVAGLEALARLVDVPVHLCVGPGSGLANGIPERVTITEFSGPHPAGLVGTHVAHLAPGIGAGRHVWYVGYQDAMAMGALFQEGRPQRDRSVSIGGPGVAAPRIVRTIAHARIMDLLAGDILDARCRVVSGSILSGRDATGRNGYLGLRHSQITVIPEAGAGSRQRSARPWSFVRTLGPRRAPDRAALTTARHGPVRAMVPFDVFDRAVRPGILAAPLLRALLIEDDEEAEALGCLELEEDDLALCTYLCPSKNDYGVLLRAALERIGETW